MRKTHRNVEFDVHRLEDGRWEWIAYPKLGEGDRFTGPFEADEETATAVAIAAIDANFPVSDPSQWSNTSDWDPSVARQRNVAFLDSGGSQIFPAADPKATLETAPMKPDATVNTPAGAFQSGAFQDGAFQTGGKINLEARSGGVAHGAGGMSVDADVASVQRRVIAQDRAVPFRDNAERAEMLARALATTIREEIRRLEDRRLNEPEWRDQIDFLRGVADALDNIVTAISDARRAATPEAREQKFSEVERLATSLAIAAKGFAERNYERVTDYGGYCIMTFLGTLLFTTALGASPDVALAAQMAMFGLFGKKKE
jgi:hypothetical protein